MVLFRRTRCITLIGFLCFFLAPANADPGAPHDPIKLDPTELESLDSKLRSVVETKQGANLSYGVWQNGKLIREGYFGPVSEQNTRTVSGDTIQQVYSFSKVVTAVGLLTLYEKGAFRLDDPITKVLPEFAETEVLADVDEEGNLYTYLPPRPPTMRQLLSHTAGFGSARDGYKTIDRLFHEMDIDRAKDAETLVSMAASLPYASAPGAEWNYSIASELQGAVIERLSGQSLHDYLKQAVFDPLDMEDTGFFVEAENQSRLSGVTTRTERGGWKYEPPEDSSEAAQSETYFEGGWGLYSTQRDFARFLSALLDDRGSILRADTLAELRANAVRFRGEPAGVFPSGHRAGLGFGFGLGTIEDPEIAEMAAPSGTLYWKSALGGWFWVDPKNDIIFIGMLQSLSPTDTDLMRISMNQIYGVEDDWLIKASLDFR